MKVAHPLVSGGLNLTCGTAGTAGLDQFGRVIDQKWEDDTPTTKDRFAYGYDPNSNRLYRENMVNSAFSELNHANNPTAGTEFDGLDRLKEWRRGTLDTEKDGLTTTTRYQTFTLDGVGNWPTFKAERGSRAIAFPFAAESADGEKDGRGKKRGRESLFCADFQGVSGHLSSQRQQQRIHHGFHGWHGL